MSSIPEELYLEILARVPAKSTYACKCVCKYWFEIISNPSFVKMNLDFNTQRENYNLIFEDYDARTQSRTLSSISYDSLWSVNGSKSDIVALADYPATEMCPIASSSYGTRRILGSCNGLVCIYWWNTGYDRSICFCNPTTKEYKIIKSESVPGFLSNTNIIAFGYDGKDDDYKLIFISGYTELLVYMLRSNTWKTSHPVPYRFPNKPQTGSLNNGAFHWIGKALKKKSPELIVVLDFCDEKFSELQLPEELLEKKHSSMTTGVLEGRLCVAVPVSEVSFQVWVMQDYGVLETWTPRYTFDYYKSLLSSCDSLKILSSLRNGHILARVGYRLFIYDPKHPWARKTSSGLNSVGYVESLVSLNSGTYAGRNKRIGI